MAYEKINTNNQILALGNWLQRPTRTMPSFRFMGGEVDGYDVYLPSVLDHVDRLYAKCLLEHPHPNVRLHYDWSDVVQEDK